MMHPKLRWVMFTAALGIVACKGDPTDSLRNGAKELRASPGSVFVPQGDSVAIVTELRDEQGNRLVADFTMTSSDPAQLPVDKDLGFIPVYDENNQLIPPTDATRSRFFVKGVGLTAGTLTATSGGLTQTIPVFSLPSVQGSIFGVGSLSSTTTALGDTVTVTIPAPWKFSPSAVAIAAAPGRVLTVDVSADSTSLRFIPGPGIDTVVSFQPAVLTYGPASDPFAPALDTFKLSSSAFLNSPPIGPVTVSSTAPALGAPVTATAPAGFRFTPTSTVIIVDTTAHDTTVTAVTGLSPDSSQLTFVPFPNGSGLVFVDTMVVGLNTLHALGNYTLASTQTLTSAPPPANFPATVSTASPAIQDTVILTATGGFGFLPTAVVHHDSATGATATILSVTATTISFIARVGAGAGPVFVDGVTAGVLQFTGLASSVSITPALGFSGTNSFATAPTLAIPGVGSSVTYLDGGNGNIVPECDADQGAPCRVYKFVMAAPGTVTFSATWQGTTDLGLYFYDNAGTLLNPFPTACDAGGNGPTGQPETCSQTLAAGTYFLTVVDFGPFYPEPEAAWIQLDISQ